MPLLQFDIRRLDVYRKIPKDLTQPTFTGAFISICSILFILFLFFSELHSFLTPEIVSELFVDDPVAHNERIPVSIDVTLPKMKCEFIGLDIQDDLGRHEVGFVENVDKIDLDDGAGCRFQAKFKINKVPGNFHISTHASRKQPDAPDMTHIVHHVVFGDSVEEGHLPGSFNPLKGRDRTKDVNALSTHDYFMKVVPSVYETAGGETFPYQYTFAYRNTVKMGHHGQMASPAIWWRVDLSPITVKYSVKSRPFYQFLTSVCAIVGGTFTVAGIIDSAIYTAAEVFRKAELGKLS